MSRRKSKTHGEIGVIYARYSSHAQRDVSIEQQVNEARQYAAELGIKIVDVYADRAVSGRSDRRPEFQRMLRDAEQKKFAFVIAWKSNRMGRNMLQAMANEERLSDAGVRCLYTAEDFDDTAAGRFALRSMMNVDQFYSENMAEDIRRGIHHNATNCMVTNGQLPYGFKPGPDQKYAVDEPAAAIVREIFRRVANEEPLIEIARDLNRRGLRTSHGKEWNRSSFHCMLHNERYTGVYIYSDVRIEGGVPQIVDPYLFYKVQEVLKTKKNAQGAPRRSNNADYLLTGKLFCGLCSNPMVGVSGTAKSGNPYYYYVCQGKRKHKTCHKKNVPRQPIEDAVAHAIYDYALQDDMIDWIAEQTIQWQRKQRDNSPIPGLQSRLTDTKKAIANILSAIEQGVFTASTKDRLLELEEQQKHLTYQIEEENSKLTDIQKEDLIAALHSFRDGNISSQKFRAKLFDTFLRAVYAYDDELKIVFSYSKDKNTVQIPFDLDELSKCSYKLSSPPPSTAYTNPAPAPCIVTIASGLFLISLPFGE